MKKLMIRIVLIVTLLLPASGCALALGPGLIAVGGTLLGGSILLSDEKPKPEPEKETTRKTQKETTKKAADETALKELDELF